MHVVVSETDQACPYFENLNAMQGIPFLTTETLIGGQDHLGMLNNDAAFLNSLYAAMPETSIPVDDALLCPIIPLPPAPPEPQSTCLLEFNENYQRRSRSPKKSSKKNKKKGRSGSSRRMLSSSNSKSSNKIKSRGSSSKSRSSSPRGYTIAGECTQTEIRGLVRQHDTAVRLG